MLLEARMPPPSGRVHFPFSHLWVLVPGRVVSALGQGGLPVSQSAGLQVCAQFCVLTTGIPEEGVQSEVFTLLSWEAGLLI